MFTARPSSRSSVQLLCSALHCSALPDSRFSGNGTGRGNIANRGNWGSGKNPGPGGRVSADGATVRSRALHTLVAFFYSAPGCTVHGCSSPIRFGRLTEYALQSAGQQTAACRVICPPFCTIPRFRLANLLPVTVFARVFASHCSGQKKIG